MKRMSRMRSGIACYSLIVLASGCSNLQMPATASIAVSGAAVESAEAAGGNDLAPVEMTAARSNLALARNAMADKDYGRANDFSKQAEADAKLAQGKANSAKAKLASSALEDDLRALREELARKKQ